MSARESHIGERDSTADFDVAVRARVAAVAAGIDENRAAITQEIMARLASRSETLRWDPGLGRMLTAVVEAGVGVAVQMLEHDLAADQLPATPLSVEYARMLAQRDVPITALVAGSNLIDDVVLQWCLERLEGSDAGASIVARTALVIMAKLSARSDRVFQEVLEAYDAERETWLFNRSAARSARIGDLLAGRPCDPDVAEGTLGYRLHHDHLGLVFWIDDVPTDDDPRYLERCTARLADRLGCSAAPLFEPRDEHTAWVWLPFGAGAEFDLLLLIETVAGWERPVTVAAGALRAGVEGFARTHQQAVQAQVVALASGVPGSRVVPIEEVGAVALMCENRDATREWVYDVLGPLAADEPAAAQCRDTVRVFLSTGSSYTATATALNMHKNSVAYRVHKAEGKLGRKVYVRRLDLENALALCHWLGPAVLRSASDQRIPHS